MTLSRLFRTALFSVLGLFVAGGLMAAQAQDFSSSPEVVVDQDDTPQADETNISDGLDNLSGQVGSDGVGRLTVIAGDYTSTDADLNIGDGNSNIDGIDDLKIVVDRDGGDDTDQLTVESLRLSGGVNLTVESDAGSGFIFVQTGVDDGSGITGITGAGNLDFALESGTLALNESDVLEFQDPVNGSGSNTNLRIYRADGSSISGQAPVYNGNINNLEYDADGGDIVAGNELGTTSPSSETITRVRNLDIADAGGTGSTNAVTLGVDSLSVNSYTHSEDDNVTVQGNLTVESVGVSNSGTLTVNEDLTVEGGGVSNGAKLTVKETLDITGSSNSLNTGADVAVTNNLVVDNNIQVSSGDNLKVGGDIDLAGSGTTTPFLDVNGTVNSASAGSPASAGNLDFTRDPIDRNSAGGALIDVEEGTAVFNEVSASLEHTVADAGQTEENTLITDSGSDASDVDIETLDLDAVGDENDDDDNIVEILDATQSGTTFDVTTVSVSSVDDGGSGSGVTDQTLVDITNDSGGDFTVGGSLNDISNGNNDSSVEVTSGTITGQLDNSGASGLVTISGVVTYDYATSTSVIDNSGSGNIDISAEEDTLKIDVGGSASGPDVLDNNGTTDGGVSGSGVLLVTDGDADNGNRFDIGTGSSSNELSNVINEVALDIEDQDGGATQINAADVIARAPLTFGIDGGGVGAVEVTSLTVEDDGDPNTTNTVDLASSASTFTVTNDLTVSGEEANFTNASGGPGLIVQDDLFLNASPAQTTLDLTGIETEIQSSFYRESDPNAILTTGTGSTLDFQSSAGQDTLSAGSKFTINGNLHVDKGEGTLRLVESVAVAGDVDVKPPSSPSAPVNQFILAENLFLSNTSGGSTNAGTFTFDSNVSTPGDSKIIVDGGGTKTLSQDVAASAIPTLPTVPDLDVKGGGGAKNVVVDSDLQFDGNITLSDGGITINSDSDFSPTGDGAQITRFLDGPTSTEITEAASGDSFNGDGVKYDLEYTVDSETSGRTVTNVDDELTNNVRDLTIRDDAVPQLTASSPDPFRMSGRLNIEGDRDESGFSPFQSGRIAATSGNPTVELTGEDLGSDESHSVDGAITGGSNKITLKISSGATLNGSDESADPSLIQGLSVSASGATVSNVQRISRSGQPGGLFVAENASLNLGLANPGDDDVGSHGDQTIADTVRVNGTLNLDSQIDLRAGSSPALTVNDNGSGGTLGFGDSNLFVSNGENVDANSDASFSSSGGSLIFTNSSGSDLGTAGVTVPSVRVEEDINVVEGVDVSDSLRVDGSTITLDASGSGAVGDSLSYSGEVTFTGSNPSVSANNGGEEFISKGTTVTLESATTVENFTVDSGGSETTVTDDGTGSNLTVSGQFTMQSGDLGQDADIDLTGSDIGSGDDVNYGADAGSINWTSGDLIFSSNDKTFALEKDFTIPYLRISDGQAITYGDDENIVIGTEVELQDDFEFGSANGSLEITENATIVRNENDTGDGVLTEAPVFPSSGTYDVEYNDDLPSSSNTFDTSYELDAAAGTIGDVTINEDVDVVDKSSPDLTGTVTINGTLSLNAGSVSHGDSDERQIAMAGESTLLRDGGSFDGGDAVQHEPQAPSDAHYTLEYDDGTSSAADEEFLDTGQIDLVTRITGSGSNELNVLPGADRTVRTFQVENGARDTTNLSDGTDALTLTVSDTTDLNGGQLSEGTLDADDNVEVNGATVASDVNAAGDFVFNSGSLAQVDLAFDGDSAQEFQLANPAVVTNLSLEQQSADPQPQVDLTGENLGVSNRLTLENGLLVIAEGQFLALSQAGGPTTGPFGGTSPTPATVNRIVSAPDKSHVLGAVQQGIAAGTPDPAVNPEGRFEWPVGNAEEYRPAFITFSDGDPINTSTNIRITHVDENPQGTAGLPVENVATNNEGDSLNAGSYPEQYWQTEVTTGIQRNQTFDLEFETGAEGFTDQFGQAQELRIIRRFDGDADENDWALQGDPGSYNNALFRKDTDGDGTNDTEFVSTRTSSSAGGLPTQGTRFTIGLPARAPRFLQALGDETIAEGETLSGTFEATSRDLNQDVTLSLGDLPDSVDPDSVTFTSPPEGESVSDTTSGEFTFTPGREGGTRDLTFTVQADDGDATPDTSFTVTVNDVNRAPTIDEALSDATVEDGETLRDTVTATDPDGDALGFGLAKAPDGASIDTSSGAFSWTPTFEQAGESYEIVANVTDGETTIETDTAEVTVNRSLAKGDPTGDGTVGPLDASVALFIFGGEDFKGTEVDESDPTPAQADAADFNDDGNVTSFDASLILQEAASSSGSAAVASKASSGSATGSVRLTGQSRSEKGTMTVPVELSEDASGVQSVALDLEIDPSAASVADLSTDLPEGWIAEYWTQDDGTVTVGMAGATPIDGGQIGALRLKVDGSDATVEPEGTYRLNAGSKRAIDVSIAPQKFALKGNYPNPVGSSTTIEYSLKKSVNVEISVYDALGRKVATPVNGQKSAGRFEVSLDTRDLSSGVYFYRIQAGDFTASKKMTVVR